MPTPQITNPNSAFGNVSSTGVGLQGGISPLLDGATYVELVAAATITAGQTVAVNSSMAAIVGTASNMVIGIAIDSVVSGQVVRIVTNGIVLGLCIAQSGGVTAGTIYSPAAAGSFTTASTTIGSNIIAALTTATATNTFNAFVQKM